MDKPWYKSKGAWGGVLLMAGGIATAFGNFLNGAIDMATMMDQAVPLFLNGLGIFGIRLGVDWKQEKEVVMMKIKLYVAVIASSV